LEKVTGTDRIGFSCWSLRNIEKVSHSHPIVS
jgi:hypothetical protein